MSSDTPLATDPLASGQVSTATLVKTALFTAIVLAVLIGERYVLPRIGLADMPPVPLGQFQRLSAPPAGGTGPGASSGLIGASLALAAGEMTPLSGAALDRLRDRGGAARAWPPRPSPAAADALKALPGAVPRTLSGETPCLEGACPNNQPAPPAAADPDTTGSIATALNDALPVRQARVFAAIDVLDGRSFRADGATIRLANLALPGPRQQCRRLDGVTEPCAERARTRLDLMTRHRPVACDLAAAAPGAPLGATSSPLTGDCRVGDGDLALRLIREGWATPLSDTPEAAAALAEARRAKAGIWR